MNFYKHFIGDYQRDTAHLTMMEHAAYRMLLDHQYATELPLPMPAQCQRICRAITKEEQDSVLSVLEKFFPDGVNKRAMNEINKMREYKDAQAMRAHMRWHSSGMVPGNASHSHSHSNTKTNKAIDESPILQTLPLIDGSEFQVRQSLVAELEPLYPLVDISATVSEMKGWLIGNPERRKTRRGVRSFMVKWLQREQEKLNGGSSAKR